MKAAEILGVTSTLALFIALSTKALAHGNDDPLLGMFTVEQLEHGIDQDHQQYTTAAGEAWIGYDLHKLSLQFETQRREGHTENGELQLRYSKAISAFWDIQGGLRRDRETDSHWGVIGISGIAPYNVELDASVFLASSERSALRLTLEYALRFTQSLVLIPEIEVDAYGQGDADHGYGAGLAESQAALRLHYFLAREFAPYIAVSWEAKHGDTARYARTNGEDSSQRLLQLGVRFWF